MRRLTLPYPPSVNHYWRAVKGRMLISEEGRRYRLAVSELASDRGAMEGRLHVSAYLTMPDNRRRDIDNVLKALLDACQYAGVYMDDSQIDHLEVVRGKVAPPGSVSLVVREVRR